MPYHLRFLLQAYPSMYFNEYVLNRWEKWLFLLQWDILVDRFNSNWVKTAVYDFQKVYWFDYVKLKKEKSENNFFEPEPHPIPLLIGEGSRVVAGEVNVQDFYPIGGASDKASEWQFDENKRFSTWPMLWWNLLLPSKWTKSRVRDNQLLELAEFDEWMQQVCKIYNLRWVRRVLFVKVPDLKFEWDKDDIKLQFFLPTWSYATTLISFILQWIDYLTLKDNSLLIPRIFKK